MFGLEWVNSGELTKVTWIDTWGVMVGGVEGEELREQECLQ